MTLVQRLGQQSLYNLLISVAPLGSTGHLCN
uniref:Uncharacterized protein n=1 Tax=Setaria italica TaxID=4555 RepID=K3XUJ2_SETIT